MMAYEKRKEAHADMMFDKTVEQLDDSELQQVMEAAAEEIKDQYNNYDRVPPLIKKLSRNILVGSFVQFPAEMMRNTANTIGTQARPPHPPSLLRLGNLRRCGAIPPIRAHSCISTRPPTDPTNIIFSLQIG